MNLDAATQSANPKEGSKSVERLLDTVAPLRNRWVRLCCAALLVTVLSPFKVSGEEKARYEGTAAHGPIPFSLEPMKQTVLSRLWLASEEYTQEFLDDVGVRYGQFSSIVKIVANTNLRGDPEVSLLRYRLPSRYSAVSYAGIRGSYGQFFDEDVIGRSRTGGVGLKDKDWFYVKLTFQF